MDIEKIKENILNNVPFEMSLSDISTKSSTSQYNDVLQTPPRPSVEDYGGAELSTQTTTAAGYPQPSNFSEVFLTDLIQNTPVLDQSRFIQMKTLQERIPKLDGSIKFENLRNKGISGTFSKTYEKDNEDAESGFDDDWLNAKELVSFYSIHEQFLRENLEGFSFLNHLSNFLAAKAAPELENVYLYSRRPDTNSAVTNAYAAVPSSYKFSSGIFERIKANNMVSPVEVEAATPLLSFVKYIKWASSVKPALFPGKPGILPRDLVAYLPTSLLLDIQYEASQRGTNLGDNYIAGSKFGEYDRLYQVRLIPCDSLETPVQVIDYEEIDPDDPTDPGVILNKEQLTKKVLVTVPNNIIYGIYDNIKTRFQFDLRDLSYVSALQIATDQQLLWPRLTSYANIDETGGILGLAAIEDGGFSP